MEIEAAQKTYMILIYTILLINVHDMATHFVGMKKIIVAVKRCINQDVIFGPLLTEKNK